MSASEKLKVLDEFAPEFPDDSLAATDPEIRQNMEALASMRRALPQFVAVVEAAEALTAAVDYSIAHGLKPSLGEATAERVRLDELLRPALAALDEALS